MVWAGKENAMDSSLNFFDEFPFKVMLASIVMGLVGMPMMPCRRKRWSFFRCSRVETDKVTLASVIFACTHGCV